MSASSSSSSSSSSSFVFVFKRRVDVVDCECKNLKEEVCSNRFFGGFEKSKFSLSFSLSLSLSRGEHSLSLCSRVLLFCPSLSLSFLLHFFPSLSLSQGTERRVVSLFRRFDECSLPAKILRKTREKSDSHVISKKRNLSHISRERRLYDDDANVLSSKQSYI